MGYHIMFASSLRVISDASSQQATYQAHRLLSSALPTPTKGTVPTPGCRAGVRRRSKPEVHVSSRIPPHVLARDGVGLGRPWNTLFSLGGPIDCVAAARCLKLLGISLASL